MGQLTRRTGKGAAVNGNGRCRRTMNQKRRISISRECCGWVDSSAVQALLDVSTRPIHNPLTIQFSALVHSPAKWVASRDKIEYTLAEIKIG